jgi:glutaredoxin
LRLTLYSKPGCHLCDEMKAVIRRVSNKYSNMSLDEVDISTDPVLLDRYGLEIPVLEIDGKKVAKYRIAEDQLRRIVDARERKGPRAPSPHP